MPGGCLIVLHWLNAQLAMIQSGFVKLEPVFLPYAQDAADVTVCEHLKEQKFSDYSLTEGESPVSQQAVSLRRVTVGRSGVSSQAPNRSKP